MLNKEKRSTLLSFLLGDGCLYGHRNKVKQGNKIYSGELIISHTYKQKDLLEWKKNIIENIIGKKLNMRKIQQNNNVWDIQTTQYEIRFSSKKFRSWRKFCYPNNRKDLSRVLRFILDKDFALAVWLMDDGNCQATSATFHEKFTAIRLHTCDQFYETHVKLVEWFKNNYNVEPKIKIQYKKKTNRYYYYLVFNVVSSLIIWEKVRHVILTIPSMKYKFRTLENRYQLGVLQPQMRD